MIVKVAAKYRRLTHLVCALLKIAVNRWLQSEARETVFAATVVGRPLLDALNPLKWNPITPQEMVDYTRVLMAFWDCHFLNKTDVFNLTLDYRNERNVPQWGHRLVVGYYYEHINDERPKSVDRKGNANSWYDSPLEKRVKGIITEVNGLMRNRRVKEPGFIGMLNKLTTRCTSVYHIVKLFYVACIAKNGGNRTFLIEILIKRAIFDDSKRCALYVALCAKMIAVIDKNCDLGFYNRVDTMCVGRNLVNDLIHGWGKLLLTLKNPKGKDLVPFVEFLAYMQRWRLMSSWNIFDDISSRYNTFLSAQDDKTGLEFPKNWIKRLRKMMKNCGTSVEQDYREYHDNFPTENVFFEYADVGPMHAIKYGWI
ncbi:hypothetical protein L596_001260 [Steinernema carpocapsae]|uniref:Uncharacterized protein n=1 Tax=Steinernema carpocapsae TaxID=34508 RepID=A0A4U8ULS3_STECR|nr:hypothetical protein L596_001260 [Steinernema carpocapsae]